MPPVNEALGQLPSGYMAAPVSPARNNRLFDYASSRKEPDPVAGHWVLLRDTLDARVLLGAVTDSAGTLHRYVEIWIQTIDSITASTGAQRDALTNKILDERWAAQYDAMHKADPSGVIATGWEARHPVPLFIDLSKPRPLALAESEGGAYQLCQDDAVLTSAGLPAYSTSLDRYVYQPALGANAKFLPVTPGSPANERVRKQALSLPPTTIPLNPGGGLLMIRDYNPLSFDDLMGLLQTASWKGIQQGTSFLQPIAVLSRQGAESEGLGDEALLMSRTGKAGRFIETFYLRLCAVSAAVTAVRDLVQQTQRPILNLTADSFRATLYPPRPGLPTLWSMGVSVTDPGDAIPLAFEGTDTHYYLRGKGVRSSVYRPSSGDGGQGDGIYRIRQVLPEGRGVVIEGTFSPRDRITASRNDLLRIRLNIAAGRVDLYTRLQPEMALAGGEWRLRSVPQTLAPAVVAQLRAAEGVPFNNAGYEHIPLLSTPCDLYSLAVLAVSALLVKPGAPVAVALDEAYSLARQVAIEPDRSVPLAKRIGAIFSSDPRWGASLSPEHLGGDHVDQGAAAMLLPQEIWWEMLALIVRMFPGVGPDSSSYDYGDALPNAVHRVFEPAIADLDALLGKVRSLMTSDWRLNREVQWVIRQLMTPMPEAKPQAPAPPGGRPGVI